MRESGLRNEEVCKLEGFINEKLEEESKLGEEDLKGIVIKEENDGHRHLIEYSNPRNEILIITNYGSNVTLHRFRMSECHELTSGDRESVQKRATRQIYHSYALNIEIEGHSLPQHKYSPILDHAILNFIPIKLLINSQGDLIIIYSPKLVLIGELPHHTEWPEGRLDNQDIGEEKRGRGRLKMQILGELYSQESENYVKQVEFHPLNPYYVCLLNNTNSFTIYNTLQSIQDPQFSKLFFQKKLKKAKEGLSRSSRYIFNSFRFGANIDFGWDRFSIYFMSISGNIYILHPLLLATFMLDQHVLQNMEAEIPDFETAIGEKHSNLINLIKSKGVYLDGYWRIQVPQELIETQFIPTLQGPMKEEKHGKKKSKVKYGEYKSLDGYPYVSIRTTNNGLIEILLSYEDPFPCWTNSITTNTGLVGSLNDLQLFSRFDLKQEGVEAGRESFVHIQIPNGNNELFYAQYNNNIYQIALPWIKDIQKHLRNGRNISNMREREESAEIKLEKTQVRMMLECGDFHSNSLNGISFLGEYALIFLPKAQEIEEEKSPSRVIIRSFIRGFPKNFVAQTNIPGISLPDVQRREISSNLKEIIPFKKDLGPHIVLSGSATQLMSPDQFLDELAKGIGKYPKADPAKCEANFQHNENYLNELYKKLNDNKDILSQKINFLKPALKEDQEKMNKIISKRTEIDKKIEEAKHMMSQIDLPSVANQSQIGKQFIEIKNKLNKYSGTLQEHEHTIQQITMFEQRIAEKFTADTTEISIPNIEQEIESK